MIGYHRPMTLDDALAIRAACDVTVLAGGTDVYPAKATRAAWGDPAHKDVLDISALPDLRGIAASAQGWRIGALTRWSDVIGAELPPLFDGLKAAAREVGGVQIQARGTLAGNLCTASPAGDGIACLMALDASVELANLKGRRVLPLGEFNLDYRRTALAADEIVTAVLIPSFGPSARSHFLKLGARRYLVISIAMVAASVAVDEAGLIVAARVAVGACSAVATRLTGLEAALAGQPLGVAPELVEAGHLDALTPIDDIRSSAAHRRAASLTLVRDCLSGLAHGASRRASA
jgi:N-methylhydantoinase B